MKLPIFILAMMWAPLSYAQDLTITIPAKTEVIFKLNSEVSTKTSKAGEIVQFTLLRDIVVDNKIVVMKDAPVFGEIIHAQKSGMGGKAGELLMTIRYVEVNHQKIPLRSLKPYMGDNKKIESLSVSFIPGVGLFAPFIRGKEIIIPAGTEGQALVAKDTTINLTPEPIDPVLPIPTVVPPQKEIIND